MMSFPDILNPASSCSIYCESARDAENLIRNRQRYALIAFGLLRSHSPVHLLSALLMIVQHVSPVSSDSITYMWNLLALV